MQAFWRKMQGYHGSNASHFIHRLEPTIRTSLVIFINLFWAEKPKSDVLQFINLVSLRNNNPESPTPYAKP